MVSFCATKVVSSSLQAFLAKPPVQKSTQSKDCLTKFKLKLGCFKKQRFKDSFFLKDLLSKYLKQIVSKYTDVILAVSLHYISHSNIDEIVIYY